MSPQEKKNRGGKSGKKIEMSPREKKKNSGGKIGKKIEMKPIVNLKRRQVCFSKLRQDLFKKVAELRIHCGAEVAVVAFSPSGTPFSYGHPSTNEVLSRVLNGDAATFETSPSADDRGDQIKRNLEYWGGLLEAQKMLRRRMEAVLKDRRPIPNSFWWDVDISSMSLPELKEYRRVLQRNRFVLALAEQRLRHPDPMEEIEKSVAVEETSGTEHGAEESFKGSGGGL